MSEGGALKGHMARALRQVRRYLAAVDAVVEVVDARAPFTSRSPQLREMVGDRLHLLVLSRGDLAEPETTQAWREWLRARGLETLVGEGAADPRLVTRLRRRLARAPAAFKPRVIIVGLPNVGKSTLLNSLAGRRRARVGAQPGVTRGRQWVDLGDFWLLDTPGVLPPRLGGTRRLVLGALGLVGPELAGPEEVAAFLLERLGDRPAFRAALARWGIAGPGVGGPAGDAGGGDPGRPGGRTAAGAAQRGPALASGGPAEQGSDGQGGRGAAAAGSGPGGMDPGAASLLRAAASRHQAEVQGLLEDLARHRGLLGPGGEPDVHRAAAVLVAAFRTGELGRFSLEQPGMVEGSAP
ncbi:ribosome biogenesis GTP-binding protein YlqF [Thermaerobacter marianensis DSM 12885]|uniref:Ribosome biogenesis GTP-binding protein YlqF n=1 Tax=Thermaerobacter marianensis (strain ATCC 700841 / DSM 12885 / JCM 10246 / 7p75a) TaxID=644966 RepID=E6SJL4_THEM7|nr:GTPase [Thermaerobacter marianensis]ADU51077.1 ribosome biogenesis GTP-binding protein YlqF [Thermaerobacter marianensis DSM 12885]